MLVSEQWLREWVAPDLDTDGLVECLTMAGLEVDSVGRAGPRLERVVTGRIVAVEPHPDTERLSVCQVGIGKARVLQIVCGAKNVRAGLCAPVALAGAVLPNGAKIEETELHGVRSHGMLCSEMELGLADQSDQLFELDDNARPGQALTEYLYLEDAIIDIDLAPNRGDCLSILGIARELAVLSGAPLKRRDVPGMPATVRDKVPLRLDAPELCPRYVGRVIRDIASDGRSPVWMRERLRRCGIRPISPVVDVTNYVMLELGQPMHAFDLERLAGGIVVRTAKPRERLTLLDGQSLRLTADSLVIADHQQSIALAGIMGGAGPAISETTRNIVLEAAHFQTTAVAGKARHYGLQTDSAHRFERGVDPALPRIASHYATVLLQDIVGGQPGPVFEAVQRQS
jgi:phenylalanyl-tRNA synthetase beta chain